MAILHVYRSCGIPLHAWGQKYYEAFLFELDLCEVRLRASLGVRTKWANKISVVPPLISGWGFDPYLIILYHVLLYSIIVLYCIR